MAQTEASPEKAAGRDSFIESLMDTDLYSMGAFFCDEHPELVDEVVQRSVEIEERGLAAHADAEGIDVETGKQLLLRLRERALERELSDADFDRTKELQAALAKVREAVREFA